MDKDKHLEADKNTFDKLLNKAINPKINNMITKKEIVELPGKSLETLPKQILKTGKVEVEGIIIECYHLDNGMRMISKSGMQKCLGFSKNAGGSVLDKLLLTEEIKNAFPDKTRAIESGLKDGLKFKRIGGGGALPGTYGYEATFLMDICHFIQDAYLAGFISDTYTHIYANARILSRAFSKIGIYALIDEATGYLEVKHKEEYAKLFREFLLDEAQEWSKTFPDTFFNMVWKLWLNKEPPKNSKRPPFFAQVIRNFVYAPLAMDRLGYTKEAYGILLKQLDSKNSDRKHRHHQFLDEIGKEALKSHFQVLDVLASISDTKEQFKKNFRKRFNLPYQEELL